MAATNWREGKGKWASAFSPTRTIMAEQKQHGPHMMLDNVSLGKKKQHIIVGRKFRPLRVPVVVRMLLYRLFEKYSAWCLHEGKNDLNFDKQISRLGTWNLRRMYERKLALVTKTLDRCKIGICGTSELRWNVVGSFHANGWISSVVLRIWESERKQSCIHLIQGDVEVCAWVQFNQE